MLYFHHHLSYTSLLCHLLSCSFLSALLLYVIVLPVLFCVCTLENRVSQL